MMSRARSVCSETASRLMFMGYVARIHRLPSSNSGMNSRPKSGSKHTVMASRLPMTANVTQRYFRHNSS